MEEIVIYKLVIEDVLQDEPFATYEMACLVGKQSGKRYWVKAIVIGDQA